MEINENTEKEILPGSEINNNPQAGKRLVLNEADHSSSGQPIRYAGFWMRFWAYLLDITVIGSIERIIINPTFRSLDITLWDISMFAPVSIASAIIFYFYFVIMTRLLGQTLGKMVFGIKVVNTKKSGLTWGTVLFREWIGRFICSTIIFGYVVVAFIPKKQGIHDLFADTIVVHADS